MFGWAVSPVTGVLLEKSRDQTDRQKETETHRDTSVQREAQKRQFVLPQGSRGGVTLPAPGFQASGSGQ